MREELPKNEALRGVVASSSFLGSAKESFTQKEWYDLTLLAILHRIAGGFYEQPKQIFPLSTIRNRRASLLFLTPLTLSKARENCFLEGLVHSQKD